MANIANKIILSLCLISLLVWYASARAVGGPPVQQVTSPVFAVGQHGKAAIVNANPAAYAAISQASQDKKPMLLKDFPLGPDGVVPMDLEVVGYSVLTPDAKIVKQLPNGDVRNIALTVQMVRGRIAGNPNSQVYLGFTKT